MKMTETFYRTGTHKIDRSSFGGIIYPSDFNTDHRGKGNLYGSYIANRIISDREFDRQCRLNGENSNRLKENKQKTSKECMREDKNNA